MKNHELSEEQRRRLLRGILSYDVNKECRRFVIECNKKIKAMHEGWAKDMVRCEKEFYKAMRDFIAESEELTEGHYWWLLRKLECGKVIKSLHFFYEHPEIRFPWMHEFFHIYFAHAANKAYRKEARNG